MQAAANQLPQQQNWTKQEIDFSIEVLKRLETKCNSWSTTCNVVHCPDLCVNGQQLKYGLAIIDRRCEGKISPNIVVYVTLDAPATDEDVFELALPYVGVKIVTPSYKLNYPQFKVMFNNIEQIVTKAYDEYCKATAAKAS